MKIENPLKIYLCDLIHDRHINNYSVPLNIGYIAQRLNQRFDKKVDISLFKFPDLIIEAIKNSPPDVLALSNYDWNVNLNKAIISIARKIDSEILIVMGGPNIRKDEESQIDFLMNNDLDMYVLNEGEDAFSNIVEKVFEINDPLFRTKLLHDNLAVDGVIFLDKQSNSLIKGEKPSSAFEKIVPFESPWLNGWLDQFLDNDTFPLSASIETNRNCPYQCNFCVWGDFELNKIRVFDIDTVLDEISYICETAKNNFNLTIVDANFGILKRDLIIAQHVRDMSDKHKNIDRVFIAQSKNTQKRNLEISKILGKICVPEFAVQTLTEGVLEKSGRKNLSNIKIREYVSDVNAMGNEVMTDILLGLPGESKDNYIKSMKNVVKFGFQRASVADIRLLKGSVYDTEDYRNKYGLVSKFRVIPSSYGIYDGQKVIEYEECIRQTNDMSSSDFQELRLFNANYFLLYYIELGRPLLDHCNNVGMHGIDLISYISKDIDKDNFPLLYGYVRKFNRLSENEWFNATLDANKYYHNDDIFNKIMSDGFPKLNYDFASEIILDRKLMDEYFEWIYCNIIAKIDDNDKIINDIINVCKMRACSFPINNKTRSIEVNEKSIQAINQYFMPLSNQNNDAKTEFTNNTLSESIFKIKFGITEERFQWLTNILNEIDLRMIKN